MERSRVTVEYKHLQQQVFEHEAAGVHCVVQSITGGQPEHLTLAQALDAVETRLARWPGPMEGFARPVTNYSDSYQLVVPGVIQWDLWPRVFVCDRCGRVFRTGRDTEDLRRHCVDASCGGTHRQLPYFRVHRCGRRMPLSVPQCRTDASHQMHFRDSGSWMTASFFCGVCRSRQEINAGNCNCAMTGLEAKDRRFRLVKARDSKSFYGHHVTVVNISARLARALDTPRGPLWAFAHYLRTIDSLTGLVDEANGRQSGADQQAALQSIQDILNNTPGLTEDQLQAYTGALNATRGEEPGLEAAQHELDESTIEAGRGDRRLFERGFIFEEREPEELGSISARYRSDGHHGMAARLDYGAEDAARLGFARVAVIRQLPIALVGFGFTREFSDERAQLRPLDPAPRDRSARRPLVAVESNTEGVFFELDPLTLWSWCHENGWTTDKQPESDLAARAWLLRVTYAPAPSDASLAIQRLTHAWAHTLIHALEGRSAFGPNSVAEYLMERTASFFIYVANYSTFNLGGLTSLVEQHLADWMDAAVEQTTCVHDPVCLHERGGCHKCISIPYNCERFNRGLHRGYLVGSEDPNVTTGWIVHAASAPR
jgi:hypothetical protein